MLSMSVVFVVVIQWPISTNMKPSWIVVPHSYPFSTSRTCKGFKFAKISQKILKQLTWKISLFNQKKMAVRLLQER